MAPKDEKYATPQGFQELVKVIEASRFDLLETKTELEARIAITKGGTKLKLMCNICKGALSTPPMVFTFVNKKGFSQKCNKSCLGSWKDGHKQDKLLAKIAASRFELDESEDILRRRIVGQQTLLRLKCTICDKVSTSCKIGDFWSYGSAECDCSRPPRWSSEAGMERLQRLIQESRFELTVDLQTLNAKILEHGCNTRLPLQCTDCGALSDNQRIDAFRVFQSAKCDCQTPQTEARVLAWCKETYNGKAEVLTQLKAPGCGLRMDIVVVCMHSGKWIVAIEIDGDQHFMQSLILAGSNTAKNDLIKERAVVGSGVPVVRLYQPVVWYNISIVRSFDWKSFLSKKIDDAIAGCLAVEVHCHPERKVYREGVYARLRMG